MSIKIFKKISKISQNVKNPFFSLKKSKKCNVLSLNINYYYICHLRRILFDQSSPVLPVSESRGRGSPERDGARTDRWTEILMSNIILLK